MKTFLTLTRNHRILISIVVVVTILSASGFGYIYNQKSFSTTVFLNIGVKTNQQTSPLDAVQAADAFTETVMGWFKNPDFLLRIQKQSGYEADPTARKQEKQNLVVSYKTQTEEQSRKVYIALSSNLQSEIQKYDIETSSGFIIASFSRNTVESRISLAFFAIAGLLIGLMLGYFFAALLERILKELHEYRN